MTPTPTVHEPKQLAVCEPGEYYLLKMFCFLTIIKLHLFKIKIILFQKHHGYFMELLLD